MQQMRRRLVAALVVAPLCATAVFLGPLVMFVALGLFAADGAASAVAATWYLGVPLAILCLLIAFTLELTLAMFVRLAKSSLWRVAQPHTSLGAACCGFGAALVVLSATESLFVWPVALLAGLAGAVGGWVFVRVRDVDG